MHLLAGPGWERRVRPAGIADRVIKGQPPNSRLRASTAPSCSGPDDLDNVKKIQEGYRPTLSAFPASRTASALTIDWPAPLTPTGEDLAEVLRPPLDFTLRLAPTMPSEQDVRRFARSG